MVDADERVASSKASSHLLVAEGCLEGRPGQFPQQGADVAHGLGSAVQAVHAGAFPLDRDGAVVADRREGPEGVLPGDVAVPGRDEVPCRLVTMFVSGGPSTPPARRGPTTGVRTAHLRNSGFGNTHAETAPLPLEMAVVVLTLVPLLVVYPFTQKHFRTGVLTGAIKG